MFSIPVLAQTASATAASDGGLMGTLTGLAPILLVLVLGYFMIMRPQQIRARDHRNAVNAVKRNDSVVLSSGVIGKVVRVEEAEVGVEIAQGVTVKVMKSMIAEVRTRGDPAPANDAKSKKS